MKRGLVVKVGIVLVGLMLAFGNLQATEKEDFRLLLMSADQNQVKDCELDSLAKIIKEKINPYEGMDVLSFMASMEKAIDEKADAIVLPHAIIMESENSILRDYLKKLNKENRILFLAPEVNSKNNIFSDWKSASLQSIQEGEVLSKDFRMQRKLGEFSKLLKKAKMPADKWKRLKVYL
jgi:hypothetical protein